MEYENQLLELTLNNRFPQANIKTVKDGYELIFNSDIPIEVFKELAYVYKIQTDNDTIMTRQGELEYSRPNATGNRQGTRYSTHGLHEYKGKYNPQIVKGVLDYMGVEKGSRILDPFCGSGTTMVECIHYDYPSVGTDINPMAVYISNTKIHSLAIDTEYVRNVTETIITDGIDFQLPEPIDSNEVSRLNYLKRWIPNEILCILEGVMQRLQNEQEEVRDFLKLTMSDLIREYSNQEPSDLRIRRRISPFPETPLLEAWKQNIDKYLESINSAQNIKKYDIHLGKAMLCDIRKDFEALGKQKFDAIITSPPYATALPYIDTQRISMVWLGLCAPDEIMSLESQLIGSREFVSNEKKKWVAELGENRTELPTEIDELIDSLLHELQPTDGFRKQAVPVLLYRYFVDMKKMFINLLGLIKDGGKFGLILGNNKTTIGGSKRIIDTPRLLSLIAHDCGWNVDELFPLQTYKRYGVNSRNAINSETLIILHK